MTPATNNAPTAAVGQVITPAVRVADEFNNPVANVAVTFATQSGNVTGATVNTDATGTARVGGWRLGTTTGTQSFTANAGALSSSVSDNESAGPATQIAKLAGDGQSGLAGSTITTRPSVKVTDSFGNVAVGAPVTFAVTQGNSVLVGATQVADANGVATLGGWTLGTTAGNNRVTASVAGGASVTFDAPGSAGPVTSLAIISGNAQSATVGGPVSTKPAVRARDDFGNPVAGINVTFTVASGGGSITGATTTTGADGLATVGSWTLGNTAGTNTLSAAANGLTPVTITATGTAGAVKQIDKAAGDNQTGAAGAAVSVAPAVTVKDQFGNVVSGAVVTFTVSAGGGVVAGGTKTTDASGRASVTSWTLGNSGANTLTASVNGAVSAVFNATATGSLPLVISKVSGDNSACAVNTTACSFKVHVQNSLGVATAGAVVQWSSGATTLNTTTNASGDATAANLVPQATAGTFTQTATILSTGQSVTFTYSTSAPQPGAFNIDLEFISPVSSAQSAAFTAAAQRWETVITGDIPGFNITVADSITAGYCGINHPAVVRNIDDLLIYVDLTPLDGVGNLLGQAGPCIYNTSNNKPIIGTMQFDAADLDAMLANGTLQAVITHEMGHVLGIGSMWDTGFLLTGAGGTDPFFSGVNAIDYFKRAGGTVALGNGVPVENCLVGVPSSCGQGTRDSHWRESIFKTELMTGYISGPTNPLSAVTIAALADQGYDVNFAAADAYSLPTASGNIAMDAEGASSLFELSQRVELRERATPNPRPFPRSR
jgi:adhesin/invasin